MRVEPVRRDEVRLNGAAIATLPADACRRRQFWEVYPPKAWWEAIPELFAPLVEELRLQHEAEQAKREAERAANPALAEMADAMRGALLSMGIGQRSPSRLPRMPRPVGMDSRYCHHCGREFFNAAYVHGSCCSDICMRARTRRRKAERLAELRREARDDRLCEHCGDPLEAARSTRRFCSDVCRVKAHREAVKARRG